MTTAGSRERIPKTTVCLWYNHTAEEAANFYARTFAS